MRSAPHVMLALAILSVAAARVETVAFTVLGTEPALRVSLSGRPGNVALRRDGKATRLVIAEAELGRGFGGARRASWSASERSSPAWLMGPPAGWLQRIDVGEGSGLVYLVLRSRRAATATLRRDAQGLLVVFDRSVLIDPRPTGRAPSPEETTPARPDSGAAEGIGPGVETTVQAEEDAAAGSSIAELYSRLFPATPTPEAPPAPVSAPIPQEGIALGPFRLRGALDARYVDAETHLSSAERPVRDRYAELSPRADLELPLGAGRLTASYRPALRALATYQQINSSSHHLRGALELPLGERLHLRADERFVVGTLDTRIVDPGGEYFFELGRFRRSDTSARLSALVGPRLSLELTGSAASVHFLQPSGFFDYETQRGSLGIGFDLTPNLKTVASYSYEGVPLPSERKEAESRAHALRLSLDGELAPLVTGQLDVGYRRQRNPNAGEGGRRFSGLTFSGTLTRQLSPEATLSVYLTRALPVSAHETNGFYVWTSVQAALQLPLPLALQLRFGLGQQWNDYRTAAEGSPRRRDRIFGWYAALRRGLSRSLAVSGSYRYELRRSSLATFETDSSGLLLQLEWQPFGGAP